MLYLTRREGQALIIGETVEVRVVEVRGRTVKLGITFPPEVSVMREEVFLEVQGENRAAAASLQLDLDGDAPAAEATPPIPAGS